MERNSAIALAVAFCVATVSGCGNEGESVACDSVVDEDQGYVNVEYLKGGGGGSGGGGAGGGGGARGGGAGAGGGARGGGSAGKAAPSSSSYGKPPSSFSRPSRPSGIHSGTSSRGGFYGGYPVFFYGDGDDGDEDGYCTVQYAEEED